MNILANSVYSDFGTVKFTGASANNGAVTPSGATIINM